MDRSDQKVGTRMDAGKLPKSVIDVRLNSTSLIYLWLTVLYTVLYTVQYRGRYKVKDRGTMSYCTVLPAEGLK